MVPLHGNERIKTGRDIYVTYYYQSFLSRIISLEFDVIVIPIIVNI